MGKIIAIIPARFASSRFPGKPLALICGKPMIQWVYEGVKKVEKLDEIYVATDNLEIFNCVKGFNGNAIMTSETHSCGSERLAECAEKLKLSAADIIVNIQGDEPMIKVEMIEQLISAFNDNEVYMATLKKEIFRQEDINNPNIAKLVTDVNDYAIMFSRSTIPYNRDGRKDIKYYKHIGVYGYKKAFLMMYSKLPKSMLEVSEELEQLRVIENGYKIKVIETQFQSIGVDLPEHIKTVEIELMKNR